MSFKKNVIVGFVLYWTYQLYRYRKSQLSPWESMRFSDF